jgi:hypothetical protein
VGVKEAKFNLRRRVRQKKEKFFDFNFTSTLTAAGFALSGMSLYSLRDGLALTRFFAPLTASVV